MKEFRKNLVVSFLLTLLLAALITLIIQFQFRHLVDDQQRSAEQWLKSELSSPDHSDIKRSANYAMSIMPLSSLSIFDIKQNRQVIELSSQIAPSNIVTILYPINRLPSTLQNESYRISYQLRFPIAASLIFSTLTLVSVALLISWLIFALLQSGLLRKVEKALKDEFNDPQANPGPFPELSVKIGELVSSTKEEQEICWNQVKNLMMQTTHDSMTGLFNRSAFQKDLTLLLSEEEESKMTVLALVRSDELNNINQERGYQAGDDYVKEIAKILSQTTKRFPHSKVYRVAGGDFAILLKQGSSGDAQQLGRDLKAAFDQYSLAQELTSIAHTGLTTLTSGQTPEHVLSRADIALAKAQSDIANGWQFQQNDIDQITEGQFYWNKIIHWVLENHSIFLMSQPIQSLNRNMKGYQGIFTRFMGNQNNVLPTGTMFAMAQRLELIVKLEQLILESIFHQYKLQTTPELRWGIRLSPLVLHNSSFTVWLERLLMREQDVATNLVFEMDEEVLERNLVASKRLFDLLRRFGSRSAVAKFGKGIGSFRLFRELSPDFIKLDPSLIRYIEKDGNTQQFVRMIIDTSHRMDCMVIAEGIENLGQKQVLEKMYVDGLQGYLIARPEHLQMQK
ncbi:EAL domain-containing protein [Dongshaea marina]|uniref:EAL domain-containing protein n=1 Tax=Dongshaea marina TaxID=2047966 RepID=UPI000D3E1560|nr:EAL domain-containing protein [Dongshaea marina]